MSVIPVEFQKYFWDTDVNALKFKENQDYIITRLLQKAGMPGYIWVKDHYTPEEIKITARRSRNMDPMLASYLRHKFGLSKSDMKYYTMHADYAWRKRQ